MTKNSDYWRKREQEWKNSQKKSEKEYAKEVQKIYLNTLDSVTKEIESFFSRYSTDEGISMAEAKKKVKQIDIEEYKRKAEKYVKEKNFSNQANEEMKLYNLTMKVNRLELLKANIGAELVNGSNDLETYYGEKLTEETLKKLERNASILGPSVLDNAKGALVAVDSSFQNAKWSERIWNNQTLLKNKLSNVISNALIQGKNPRDFISEVRKQFDVSRYQAETLLRTEIARAQVQAQAESYKAEDIDQYEYVACGLSDCCSICKKLDGKIFKVEDLECGENAPPMHPNCHCATAPYLDSKEYDEWLDGYKDHGLTFEEWKETNSSNALNQSTEKYLNYIEKGYSIYTPKDYSDIQYIEKAYKKAIKNASDVNNVKIKDGYHTWNVLPLKEQIKQNGNSADLYLARSGRYGGWYKIGETKTSVKFVSSSDYKKGLLDYPLVVEKKEYIEEKVKDLNYQMERTLSDIKKDALYKIAKSEKLKVTRKTSESELKKVIQNSGSDELIKKAKKYKLL